MRRRLTAWFTIAAILAGLAWPVHAHAAHARVGAGDFCTTSEAGKAAPVRPAEEASSACDACCGCAGGGAPPVAAAPPPIPASARGAAAPVAKAPPAAPQVRLSFARGPPSA